MKHDRIKEVEMEAGCLIDLIVPLKNAAWYTKHELSRGQIGDIIPCTDFEVMEYLQILKEMKTGDDPASIVISNIEWENYGNCAGDELYPVIMLAQLLPGKTRRFYVTINMIDESYGCNMTKEYIWYPPA